MSAELYGSVGGASRKVKKLYANVNGVTREVKSLWANVGGVTRKVYSGAVMWTYTVNVDKTFSEDFYDMEFGPTKEETASTFVDEIGKIGGRIDETVEYTFTEPIRINQLSIKYIEYYSGDEDWAQGNVYIRKHGDSYKLLDRSGIYYSNRSPVSYSDLGFVDSIRVYSYFDCRKRDNPRGGSAVVVKINNSFLLNNSGTSDQ